LFEISSFDELPSYQNIDHNIGSLEKRQKIFRPKLPKIIFTTLTPRAIDVVIGKYLGLVTYVLLGSALLFHEFWIQEIVPGLLGI
jgi:hypothetical protein